MLNHRPVASTSPSPDADGASSDAPSVTVLLEYAAKGDQDAWKQLVGLYARRVYALARSRLCAGAPSKAAGRAGELGAGGGDDLAEEITQSVFVTVAMKLGSAGYNEQGRFEAWLFRIAMNRIRDEARRRKRQAIPTDPESLHTIKSDHAQRPPDDRPALLLALRNAMEELTDDDREIIELRHHAGMSFKDIAEMLQEPLGTLLARHHRALRKLKDLIPPGLRLTLEDQRRSTDESNTAGGRS